jgi:hypothetical protein
VAFLEDDGFECLFRNNKCTIKFDNKVVGLAPRQGMLYMLSLNDFPVMNVCDVTNKRKRNNASDNETSSKLWHYHLGHISRGRMKHLIKEKPLEPPLAKPASIMVVWATLRESAPLQRRTPIRATLVIHHMVSRSSQLPRWPA